MKKWIILIAVLLLVFGVAYISINGLPRIGLGFLDGKRGKAILGNLEIPVTATGKIEPARLTQIKSKASGKVAVIHVVEGQMVHAGDKLLELDPVDEKRNVEAREANLARARSALEKAKIALEKQRVDLPLQTRRAEARLLDATARLTDAEFRWNRLKSMSQENTTNQELTTAKANRDSAQAARDIARSDLEQARHDEKTLLRSAEQDVLQAEAAFTEAQKVLDEAKLRYEETTVRAPSDGMVYSILAKEGEMIQSGTQSLTGGTTLMYLADTRAMFVIAQVDEADIGAIREIAPEYARPGMTQRLSEEEYRRRGTEIIKAAGSSTDEATAENEAEAGGDTPVPAEVADLIGRPVEVTVEAYRAKSYQGVIERILPEPLLVGGAVSFNVRIRLFGDELTKLMGLQADLAFKTKTQSNVVLVPNEALVSEDRDCFVWVPFRDNPRERWGKKKIAVRIGDTDGTNTVIVSGLKAGDDVWVQPPRMTDKEKREEENS